MVLEDVANRAGPFVVVGARLDAERLRNRYLDVVDELAIPDRLEDPVRESQSEHVLHGLLAQVVIDAEDLSFVEVLLDHLLELTSRGEVVAERLLDDQPRPALGRATLAE